MGDQLPSGPKRFTWLQVRYKSDTTMATPPAGAWRDPGGDGWWLGFHLLVSFSATRWRWLDAIDNLSWRCRGGICRQGQAGEVWGGQRVSRQSWQQGRGFPATAHLAHNPCLPSGRFFVCFFTQNSYHLMVMKTQCWAHGVANRAPAPVTWALSAPWQSACPCRAVTPCLSSARCIIRPYLQHESPAEINISLQ